MNDIIQLVGSIGFPAVCCLYMMKNNNDTINKLSDMVNQNTEATNNAVLQLGNLIAQFNTFLANIIQTKGDEHNG